MRELVNKFVYFYRGLDKEQGVWHVFCTIIVKVARTIYWRIRNKITRHTEKRVSYRIDEFYQNGFVPELIFPDELYHETIDVIVPIYNGYEYLSPLLNGIEKTKMNYRLFLINDCSPDKRIQPFLIAYAQKHPEVYLLKNEVNLGFLRSVNEALEKAENHVALVNTDVEVPEYWLERLMMPILTQKNIASSTPFTTCGTICSFPDFCKDNTLFEGLSLQMIDREFQHVKPLYTKIPTGVGFCMGMNINAIHRVGGFDIAFNKGYCEENDWCQRAAKKGYSNVQVENLFVYHKHGGSFTSDEKKRYQEENQEILNHRYPMYLKKVAQFCELDPLASIRDFVVFRLLKDCINTRRVLFFDHFLGGGATAYLDKQKAEYLKSGTQVYIVRYDVYTHSYRIELYYKQYEIVMGFQYFDEINQFIANLSVDFIYINELVTYPNLPDTLQKILEIKMENHADIVMLLHDYFSMCPMIYLLNEKERYCNIPDIEVCESCAAANKRNMYPGYKSIASYREMWQKFLQQCDEIRAFSHCSKELFQKVYGSLGNVTFVPHQVYPLLPIKKKNKITGTLNIGLLGMLSVHKGLEIIKEILDEIEREELPVRIILLGESETGLKNINYSETGKYNREMLPRMVLENDIDIFLISSIWPETFSYTTEEAMLLDMPVACFGFGAPAERVSQYQKGHILTDTDGRKVVHELLDFSERLGIDITFYEKKRILFFTEYESFSSRYRVDHHREQLLLEGLPSDSYSLKDYRKVNIGQYKEVILYRITKENIVQKIVKEAHHHDIKVKYDIDDFIFNYEKIKDLKFLYNEKGLDYHEYSTHIYRSMSLCDGFLTSTDTLAEQIQISFPDKDVVVNRNRPSMEMRLLSEKAVREVQKKKDKIVLGYFSGSRTHDGDFEVISDVIFHILKECSNVMLLTVGVIEIGSRFNEVKEQLLHYDFVDWKKLPDLIASVDINLMPLEDTLFHHCKSENKWVEAALVGVPTIASYTEEFARILSKKDNVILCRNKLEWENAIRKMTGLNK